MGPTARGAAGPLRAIFLRLTFVTGLSLRTMQHRADRGVAELHGFARARRPATTFGVTPANRSGPTGKRKVHSRPSPASTGHSPSTRSARHTPKPSNRPALTSPRSRAAKSPAPAPLSLTARHPHDREPRVTFAVASGEQGHPGAGPSAGTGRRREPRRPSWLLAVRSRLPRARRRRGRGGSPGKRSS